MTATAAPTTAFPFAPFACVMQEWQESFQKAAQQTLKTWEVLAATDDATVGQTPKDVIWQQGTVKLYHYRPATPSVFPVPLLMVHSLVSRPYILDLIPGNSFIEYLVGRGFDVYLIDWGVPRAEDCRLRLEDYVLDMIPRAAEQVMALSGADQFSLFGYCLGGVLALLYAATHPEAPLRNLVTLATPVDFDQMGLQAFWAQEQFLNLDQVVDTLGNVPADLIKASFKMLKPASEVSPVRFVTLWQNVLDDRYVTQYRAFDRWTNDHIPFAGEAFRQCVRDLIRENKLVKGTMELGGRPADLSSITCSLLAVAAEQDHIVTPASATPQPGLVSSEDKELVMMPGGHVGMAAGRKAVQTLWPRVAAWLAERSEPVSADEADECEELAA